MNIHNPAVIVYARNKGLTDIEARAELEAFFNKLDKPSTALSPYFAHNPGLLTVTTWEK